MSSNWITHITNLVAGTAAVTSKTASKKMPMLRPRNAHSSVGCLTKPGTRRAKADARTGGRTRRFFPLKSEPGLCDFSHATSISKPVPHSSSTVHATLRNTGLGVGSGGGRRRKGLTNTRVVPRCVGRRRRGRRRSAGRSETGGWWLEEEHGERRICSAAIRGSSRAKIIES